MDIGTQNSTFSVQQDLLAKANKALARAKNIEQKKIRQGWRWVRISKLSKILVPCKEDGTPTQEGRKKIEAIKNNINIIL